MRRHDKNGMCGKCKGSGYLKYEVVQNGVCFWCMGHGSVEKYKKWSEKKEVKTRLKDIEYHKEIITTCYIKIKEYERLGKENTAFAKSKREMAKQSWEALKRLGETMSVEEIKERAESIE